MSVFLPYHVVVLLKLDEDDGPLDLYSSIHKNKLHYNGIAIAKGIASYTSINQS